MGEKKSHYEMFFYLFLFYLLIIYYEWNIFEAYSHSYLQCLAYQSDFENEIVQPWLLVSLDYKYESTSKAAKFP